eukprot:6819544-Pyramimonas_sp.AAC.1
MERDLSKCYDQVPHEVGIASLHAAAVRSGLVAVSFAAWSGPRRCQVAGALSDEVVWPSRSFAQGDSCAPKVLCSVLAPWEVEGEQT